MKKEGDDEVLPAQDQRENDESSEEDVDDEEEEDDDDESGDDRKRKFSSPDCERLAKKAKTEWTNKEDDTLLKAVLSDRQRRKAEEDTDDDEEFDDDWDEIAMALPDKSPVQCLQRYLKLNSKPTATKATDDDAKKNASSSDDPKKSSKLEADKWTADDVDLLKKLVEAYPDCTFDATTARSRRRFSHDLHTSCLYLHSCSCSSMERHCGKL